MNLEADWRQCVCSDLAYEHHSDGSCLMPMCGCDGFVEVVA